MDNKRIMNIGYFNARGPNNGIEHWFDLEIEELKSRGHNIRTFFIKGNQPMKEDIDWMDFAHLHFAQVAEYYKRIGVPFCISPHANDIWLDNGATFKRASEHPNCKFVTYQSFYHKKRFEEWGINKPMVYLPMCCRTNLFKRETKYNPLGPVVAGGRLIPKKGLDRLKGLNNLIIFGEGPLENELKFILQDAIFTGYLDGKGLKDMFERASAFLHPAITTPNNDSDGIPNIIKEAMLMELPVLASPVAGIPELKNIHLIDYWNKINDNLYKYLDGPNIKGRDEILNIYDPKLCINRLLEAKETYGTK